MKTPRDLSGAELAKALRKLGYVITRQTGSHLRVTTQEGGEHHEVIPNHSPIKIGTLIDLFRMHRRSLGLTGLGIIFGDNVFLGLQPRLSHCGLTARRMKTLGVLTRPQLRR